MQDWRAWHAHDDDPSSPQSRRLAVVRRRIGEALATLPLDRASTVLSLCAGDRRDLLPELAGLAGSRPRAVLVEKDAVLAAAGRDAAAGLGVDDVEVVVAAARVMVRAGEPGSLPSRLLTVVR